MSDTPKRTVETFTEDLKQFVTNKILNTTKFNGCFEGIPISESRLLRLKNRIDESVINAFSEECSKIFVQTETAKNLEIIRSTKRTPDLTWRPPGDPIAQLRSVRARCKRRQLEELRILIKVTSERISKLKRKLAPFIESADLLRMKQEKIENVMSSVQALALSNKEVLEDVYTDLAESFELLYGYK